MHVATRPLFRQRELPRPWFGPRAALGAAAVGSRDLPALLLRLGGADGGSRAAAGLSPAPSPPREPLASGVCSSTKSCVLSPKETDPRALFGSQERFTASTSTVALSQAVFDKEAA